MLVSLGCVQCRNCNLNCCPVGIATQKDELRRKFAGKPEHLQTYFRFLAEEVREILASLGLHSLAEARGRTDLLVAKEGSRFDFSDLLATQNAENTKEDSGKNLFDRCGIKENYDARELIPALKHDGETVLERTISNCDRSVGAALSGHLVSANCQQPATNYQLPTVNFTGVAGQSFGAFLARGVTFNLKGEANDYVGKSLSGGVITIRPPDGFAGAPEDNIVAGNVIAYGATSGSIFINGQAGERFGIRNSGATLVAEGIGDHGCEYMTGGKVVVLGPTGVNFGAGMTGGVAYVLDETGDFDLKFNLDSIDLAGIEADSDDERELLSLIREHAARTSSPLASRLLDSWLGTRPKFVKVAPTGK